MDIQLYAKESAALAQAISSLKEFSELVHMHHEAEFGYIAGCYSTYYAREQPDIQTYMYLADNADFVLSLLENIKLYKEKEMNDLVIDNAVFFLKAYNNRISKSYNRFCKDYRPIFFEEGLIKTSLQDYKKQYEIKQQKIVDFIGLLDSWRLNKIPFFPVPQSKPVEQICKPTEELPYEPLAMTTSRRICKAYKITSKQLKELRKNTSFPKENRLSNKYCQWFNALSIFKWFKAHKPEIATSVEFDDLGLSAS